MSTFNPVVHFEMPYKNSDRMVNFYSKVFNWKMNKLGKEMNNYVLAYTAETDEDNMVQTKGAINGGFFPEEQNRSIPSIVIEVEDIQVAISKITESGGIVLGKPIDVPGIGQYISFTDTEGNNVSVLQPSM